MNKNTLQANCEYLADRCVENGEIYHGYGDDDLLNATLIFSHFLMDKIFTENQHLSLEKQEELVTSIGEAIRELIKNATGKDMHEVTKRVLKDGN